MKNIISFLFIAIIAASCSVKFVPTKSETALNMVYKVQQDANNAFSILSYNEEAYSAASEGIDSLISFDKLRVKSGTILRQDAAIQTLFNEFQKEHKAKGNILVTEQNTYKSYFKSVIDPRVVSENSLK